jgi:hypothetical protein
LVEQLRKVLDDRNISENRRMAELIAEIKRYAVPLVDDPPREEEFMVIEGSPQVRMIMDRPLWESEEKSVFRSKPALPTEEDLKKVNIGDLYDRSYVDEAVLRQRIADMLLRERKVTLAQLTAVHPIEEGLAEILAYFSIASNGEKHLINDSVYEDITLAGLSPGSAWGCQDGPIFLKAPQVVFQR